MACSPSPRQLSGFLLMALSAPAVSVCANLPWPWVLALSVLGAALLAGLLALQAGAKVPLPRLMLSVWGRSFGTVLLLGAALWALLMLWRLVPLMADSFPESRPSPILPLTLLALAAWAASKGTAAVLRGCGVLFFFLAALYAAVFLFALPDVQASRLTRWHKADLTPMAILLLPTLGLFLSRGKPPRPAAALLLPVLPVLAAVFCAAVPGSRGSFYEMAKSVEIFSLAQRIEPLVSALLTLGWFAAAALLTLSVGQMAAACGLAKKWACVAFVFLASPAAFVSFPVSDELLLGIGTIFCVFSPLFTLFVGAKK